MKPVQHVLLCGVVCVCVCVIRKSVTGFYGGYCRRGGIIEVDELDKGNISAATEKQNKTNNDRLS